MAKQSIMLAQGPWQPMRGGGGETEVLVEFKQVIDATPAAARLGEVSDIVPVVA
jgi:hypothetical protein